LWYATDNATFRRPNRARRHRAWSAIGAHCAHVGSAETVEKGELALFLDRCLWIAAAAGLQAFTPWIAAYRSPFVQHTYRYLQAIYRSSHDDSIGQWCSAVQRALQPTVCRFPLLLLTLVRCCCMHLRNATSGLGHFLLWILDSRFWILKVFCRHVSVPAFKLSFQKFRHHTASSQLLGKAQCAPPQGKRNAQGTQCEMQNAEFVRSNHKCIP
jgi:hypothetical protein